MILLQGKPLADTILQEIKEKIAKDNVCPGLTVFLVGDNPASKVYVTMKAKRAKEVGIRATLVHLPQSTTEKALLAEIAQANADSSVHGILVQLPLPKQISQASIIDAIAPSKDVDGLHPANVGKLALGRKDTFIPCTPKGVLKLLETYKIPIAGKHVVILGRSPIVGRPLSLLLSQARQDLNGTVTVLHSKSENPETILKTADIVIAAVGKPCYIKRSMLKKECWVIDVGINRVADTSPKGYHLVGDVDFADVQETVSGITPVPGGVGPLTIAMLMQNTLEAFYAQEHTFSS